LLNNTAQNGIPYFLTAAHLLRNVVSPYDVSTWEFGFDYENLTCLPSFAGSDPFMHQLISGATILAHDNLFSTGYPNTSDYLLLQLNTTASVLHDMGVCYSGWSIASSLANPSFSSSNEFVFIHHPNGDVKKISKSNNLQVSPRVTPPFSQNDQYTTDIIYGGALEGGSSGCPLYNSNHRIIGTSSAYIPYAPEENYDPCDNSTYVGQYFGRFDRHWILGNFATWLDPANLFNTANPGYSPFYEGPTTFCPNPSAQTIEPPVINTFQEIDEGIKVSGQSGATATFCSTDDNDHLTITPLVGTQFYIDGFTKKVKCSSVTGTFGIPSGCNPLTILGIPTGKCMCKFFSYSVSVIELDYNLVPSGSSGHRTYESHTWSSGLHGINSFQINVPLVLGHSLIPGKFYKISVANIVSGTWSTSSQIVYILPNNVTVSNNSNIAANLYATNNITIQNSAVSSDVQVVASNQVVILPNSTLEAGEYFTSLIDCSSFRSTIIINSENNSMSAYSRDSNYNNYIKDQESTKPTVKLEDNIGIVPNPNNGTFQVSITKNNQAIGIKEIKVYDILGKVIWREGPSLNNAFYIDITGYSQGIYYVRAVNELGEISMKKLIKK
jgi:hypothetical protein